MDTMLHPRLEKLNQLEVEAFSRAKDPAVVETLKAVTACGRALKIERLGWQWASLAGAAASLGGGDLYTAGRLYIRVWGLIAARILQGHEDDELLALAEALRGFLRVHGCEHPGSLHFRGWDHRPPLEECLAVVRGFTGE